MKAIAVRNLTTNELVVFGPSDGMYAPTVPADCSQVEEDDYTKVIEEWESRPVQSSGERDTDLQVALRSPENKLAHAIVSTLVKRRICTMEEIGAVWRASE